MFTQNGEWITENPSVPKEKIKKLRAEHRAKFPFLQEPKENKA